jgi:hypothetical protein
MNRSEVPIQTLAGEVFLGHHRPEKMIHGLNLVTRLGRGMSDSKAGEEELC